MEGKNAEQAATELGLPKSNVERLYGKNAGSGNGLAGATHKSDGGLDKALAAAGFGGGSSSGGSGASNSGANSQPLPTITPEQIVALLTALNGVACRVASTIWRVPLTDDEMQKIVRLTKDEKDCMEALAPYAAEYAPLIMQHIKPILAGAFVCVVIISTGSRVYEIRERSPKVKEARLTKIARKAPKAKGLDIEEPQIG